MSEKKKMKAIDRLAYFGYNFLHFFIFIVEYFIIVTIFLTIGFKVIWNENIIEILAQKEMHLMIILSYSLGLVIGLIYLARTLRVLLRTNLYIVDGYIFKKHKFKQNHSDSTTTITRKVRAISNDKSVSTDWISCSRWLYRQEEPSVYIVVYNNKGLDFYR